MNKKEFKQNSNLKYTFIKNTVLVTIFLIILPFLGKAQETMVDTETAMVNTEKAMKTIEIGGLVLDADSLKPINKAIIYDENGVVLAKTDKKGFFTTKINRSKENQGYFNLKVEKNKFTTFNHSGRYPTDIFDERSTIYRIGISKIKSKSKSFSELLLNSDAISHNPVLANSDKTKVFKTVKTHNMNTIMPVYKTSPAIKTTVAPRN